jgi:regulator of nucleoside diphosphate kinase
MPHNITRKPIEEGLSDGTGNLYDELRSETTDGLERELDRAHVVDSKAIPKDVVTMNSRVRFADVCTGDERVCTLVFPGDANIDQNKISVLAPIGTAMLGYRVGDTIEWRVPSGDKQVRIEEILYQPEAVGRYDL